MNRTIVVSLVCGLVTALATCSVAQTSSENQSARERQEKVEHASQIGSGKKSDRQSAGSELSESERQNLILLREEEKLARDVYLAMHEKWGERVFRNIAQAESSHMSTMASLLSRYDVADPVVDNRPGRFTATRFQQLYTTLIAAGSKSRAAALKVGLKIEELDIADLRAAKNETSKQDLKRVFENLERGSRNHLRAFSSRLTAVGGSSVATELDQQEFDRIANSPNERGGGDRLGNQGEGRGKGRGKGKGVGKQKRYGKGRWRGNRGGNR